MVSDEAVEVTKASLRPFHITYQGKKVGEIPCWLMFYEGRAFPRQVIVEGEIFKYLLDARLTRRRKQLDPGEKLMGKIYTLVLAGNRVILAGDYFQLGAELCFDRAALYVWVGNSP